VPSVPPPDVGQFRADLQLDEITISESGSTRQLLSHTLTPNYFGVRQTIDGIEITVFYLTSEKVGRKVLEGRVTVELGKHTRRLQSVHLRGSSPSSLQYDVVAFLQLAKKLARAERGNALATNYDVVARFIRQNAERFSAALQLGESPRTL
jgi:hypothetical protein